MSAAELEHGFRTLLARLYTDDFVRQRRRGFFKRLKDLDRGRRR